MPDDMVLAEIRIIRNRYIQSQVTPRTDHRGGDATDAQIAQWEIEAAVRWDGCFPALAELVAS